MTKVDYEVWLKPDANPLGTSPETMKLLRSTDRAKALERDDCQRGVFEEEMERTEVLVCAIDSNGHDVVGVSCLMKMGAYRKYDLQNLSGVPYPVSADYELGYKMVAPTHRGKGISTAIVGFMLGYAKGKSWSLVATTHMSNSASVHTLSKMGFRFTWRSKPWRSENDEAAARHELVCLMEWIPGRDN